MCLAYSREWYGKELVGWYGKELVCMVMGLVSLVIGLVGLVMSFN